MVGSPNPRRAGLVLLVTRPRSTLGYATIAPLGNATAVGLSPAMGRRTARRPDPLAEVSAGTDVSSWATRQGRSPHSAPDGMAVRNGDHIPGGGPLGRHYGVPHPVAIGGAKSEAHGGIGTGRWGASGPAAGISPRGGRFSYSGDQPCCSEHPRRSGIARSRRLNSSYYACGEVCETAPDALVYLRPNALHTTADPLAGSGLRP